MLISAPTQLPTGPLCGSWEPWIAASFGEGPVNLNPGTLGTPSVGVEAAAQRFAAQTRSFPLGAYQHARTWHALCHEQLGRLVPGGWAVALSHSTSQAMSALVLSLALGLRPSGGPPIRVLTSTHEHYGGVGGFEHSPLFRVEYAPLAALADPPALERLLLEHPPEVLLLSHVTWTTGALLPVPRLGEVARRCAPQCLVVVDAAQSLGLLPLCPQVADVTVASAHKWLGGPPGAGMLWLSDRALTLLPPPFPAGEPLAPERPAAHFEPTGGQDFSRYPALAAALALQLELGPDRILARASALARHLRERLREELTAAAVQHTLHQPRWEVTSAEGAVTVDAPVLTLELPGRDPYPLYAALNRRGIHTKCIKATLRDGTPLSLLRMGVLWHETPARLEAAAAALGEESRALPPAEVGR